MFNLVIKNLINELFLFFAQLLAQQSGVAGLVRVIRKPVNQIHSRLVFIINALQLISGRHLMKVAAWSECGHPHPSHAFWKFTYQLSSFLCLFTLLLNHYRLLGQLAVALRGKPNSPSSLGCYSRLNLVLRRVVVGWLSWDLTSIRSASHHTP